MISFCKKMKVFRKEIVRQAPRTNSFVTKRFLKICYIKFGFNKFKTILCFAEKNKSMSLRNCLPCSSHRIPLQKKVV